MATTLDNALAQLEALGNEKTRTQNRRNGAGDDQYGVKLGDIRKVAATIRTNHELGLELWETGNLDARLLAILVMVPKKLSTDELDRMARSVGTAQVADWLSAYIIRKHPEKETLRERWMTDDDPWAARAAWDLTAERIGKSPDGLDLAALLDRIESEMADAAPQEQWTMNFCLGGIGIHFPEHRTRAIAIGDALGIYRDYPVSKGCTSPFVPIWINEMVRRKG